MPHTILRVKGPSARKAVVKSIPSQSPVKSKTSQSPVKARAPSTSSRSPQRPSTSRRSVSSSPSSKQQSSKKESPSKAPSPKKLTSILKDPKAASGTTKPLVSILKNTRTSTTVLAAKPILTQSPKKDLKRLNPDQPASRPKKVVLVEPENKTRITKSNSKPKSSKSTQEDASYVVEAIVDKKKENGETMYKIRWSGYGPKDDSWVSERHCSCHWAIKQYEENRRKKSSTRKTEPVAEPKATVKRTKSNGNTFPNKRSKNEKNEPSSRKNTRDSAKESEWEDDAYLMPPPLPVSPKKSSTKSKVQKQKDVSSKKPTVVVRFPKKKASASSGKNPDKGESDPKPVPIQWNIISEKTMRTIPQLVRDRLDQGHLPKLITDARNPPPAGDDEGWQRYNCEWDDGVSCWLPGKLCCKIFPIMVCDFGAKLLLLRHNFIHAMGVQNKL